MRNRLSLEMFVRPACIYTPCSTATWISNAFIVCIITDRMKSRWGWEDLSAPMKFSYWLCTDVENFVPSSTDHERFKKESYYLFYIFYRWQWYYLMALSFIGRAELWIFMKTGTIFRHIAASTFLLVMTYRSCTASFVTSCLATVTYTWHAIDGYDFWYYSGMKAKSR